MKKIMLFFLIATIIVSCEETEYSISLEPKERRLMEEGKSYSDAYEAAVEEIQHMRELMEEKVRSHNNISVPDSLTRDSGVTDL